MSISTATELHPALSAFGAADLDAEHGIWIDGSAASAGSGDVFDLVDPATERLITAVADGGHAEAVAAVDAASRALPAWAATPARRRAEVLHRAFELMMAAQDELARLISLENGKPLADARGEVAYAAEFFRWFGEEAVRGETDFGTSPAGGTRSVVLQRPVGVAALVTPWNFPAAMATRKIAPALAAGCTVVLKPAAETPLTALAVARLLTLAEVPPGVVNVVPTTDAAGVVSTWLADDRVRKISFTGSTPVGRILLRQAADRVLNASMELGGNAPFVVAADADLAAAVDGAMVAKFRNAGQACTAANRFYVHAEVVDEFCALLGDRVAALRVGPATDPASDVGPLISRAAVERVTTLVENAVAAGARVTHQARLQAAATGYFFAPTVLRDVADDDELVHGETFGPVVPVLTWTDEEDLLARVNDSELGLAAYVYSRDVRWALQLAERIETGMVGVNRGLVSDPAAPFGGLKQSGLGREGGRAGIREYQETQYFSVDWT
jgi:succinate-semialdehyde dehydrogenase/glutarate-semialdehyde dehydrogenase